MTPEELERAGLEKLGKRELAFKVGPATEGFYVYIEAKMPQELVKELERNYKITDSIIRYLTVEKITVKPPKLKKRKTVSAGASTAATTATTTTQTQRTDATCQHAIA
jgi:ribosomal protein S6